MIRDWNVRGIASALALCAAIGILLDMQAWAGPAGVAVVIDVERAPDAKLPALDELRKNSGKIIDEFRTAGLHVASDPSGQYIAVTGPTHVSDEALLNANLPDHVIAAGIVERVTPEQLAAREKGYLRAKALSEVQLAAARRVARRHGLIDKRGQVREAGTHLALGISRPWVLHVVTHQDTQTTCRRISGSYYPPTPAAIAKPPLTGSAMWFAWPHAAADWGEKRVRIKAGTYTLTDLLATMSRDARRRIYAQADVGDTRLAVVAENAPIRVLLWAIEVATGLEVRFAVGSDPASILLSSNPSRKPDPQINVLVPIKGLGYYLPSQSSTARDLLPRPGTGATREDWIGWRLSDLPLLYRNWTEDAAKQRTYKPLPSPLEPGRTFVLWTRAVHISFGLNFEDGSGGGGPEILLPAL